MTYRSAAIGWQDGRCARRRRVEIAALVLLLFASSAPAARGPKLVGRLSGVPAKTRAVVTAIDPNRATLVASAVVGRKGRFKLPARPAVTMLFGAVEGEQSLFAASRAFRPAGRRTRVDLTLGPPLTPAVARAGARPFASGIPAPVAVVDWSMTGTLNGRSFPLANYVQGGLVRYGDRRCQLTVADGDPRGRAEIEREVARQQTEAFDPATRVHFNPVIPNVRVQGGATESGNRYTVTIRAVQVDGGGFLAESSQSGHNFYAAVERATRELAHGICDLYHGPPSDPGRHGDPYFVVVKGTNTGAFEYKTAPSLNPKCNAHDESEGTQDFSFESEPILASVFTANGITIVTLPAFSIPFAGSRTASYTFFREGPECSEPPTVDTSGCGDPKELGGALMVFEQGLMKGVIQFPTYENCPFASIVGFDSAAAEVAFDGARLDPSGATAFTLQHQEEEDLSVPANGYVNKASTATSWTVTFTPAD